MHILMQNENNVFGFLKYINANTLDLSNNMCNHDTGILIKFCIYTYFQVECLSGFPILGRNRRVFPPNISKCEIMVKFKTDK